MTCAPESPIVLEAVADRLAADHGVSIGEALEVRLPMAIEWAFTRTAADLGITTRGARKRIAR